MVVLYVILYVPWQPYISTLIDIFCWAKADMPWLVGLGDEKFLGRYVLREKDSPYSMASFLG